MSIVGEGRSHHSANREAVLTVFALLKNAARRNSHQGLFAGLRQSTVGISERAHQAPCPGQVVML
jgi:hypothetical protein